MAVKKAVAKKATSKASSIEAQQPKTTKDVVFSFQRHGKDTGSPEVQIGLLTNAILELQSHIESHKKDYDAKRSLLKKVAKRRQFMKYLKANDVTVYTKLSKDLNLKV